MYILAKLRIFFGAFEKKWFYLVNKANLEAVYFLLLKENNMFKNGCFINN